MYIVHPCQCTPYIYGAMEWLAIHTPFVEPHNIPIRVTHTGDSISKAKHCAFFEYKNMIMTNMNMKECE